MFRKNILSKDGVGDGFGPGVAVAGADCAKQVVERLALIQKNIAQINEGQDLRKQMLMGFSKCVEVLTPTIICLSRRVINDQGFWLVVPFGHSTDL